MLGRSPFPEHFGVLGDLLGQVSVVADDEDSVASMDQLSAQVFVPGSLGGLVVDGAGVAEILFGLEADRVWEDARVLPQCMVVVLSARAAELDARALGIH